MQSSLTQGLTKCFGYGLGEVAQNTAFEGFDFHAGGEARERLVAALAALGPDAGTVFAPLPGEAALAVAGILAGIDLQNLAMDVGTLVGGAPITERARMAHWSMEHPTLALGVVDFQNLGVPAQDIDGMMRVLRGFVDRAEVPNEREELIAAMERFRTEVGVRQTEQIGRAHV